MNYQGIVLGKIQVENTIVVSQQRIDRREIDL